MSISVATRVQKRVTCGLMSGGVRTPSVVLNLSRSGLFVQTSAKLRRGERVSLELLLPDGALPVRLEADVVWRREVAGRFRSMGKGGVGVRIAAPPGPYLELLEQLDPSGSAGGAVGGADAPAEPVSSAPPPDAPRFEVRLRRTGTSRSRWITIPAGDPGEAREGALREAGEGWEVLELRTRERDPART